MATCELCGSELGFFHSMVGNKKCKNCEEQERKKEEIKYQKALAELHDHLMKNYKAQTKQQLVEFGIKDASFTTIMSQLAHSVKLSEKIYLATLAKAQRSKYVKSIRYGSSMPVFGLKGFRMSSGISIPVYDMVDVGAGLIVLTDKNIHLCAKAGKPLKIPYGKIEGFHLYDDGLELYHGLQKPTMFKFKEADPMESDVIGHIIGLFTR